MNKHNLEDFIKGWFIGNFNPTIIKTNDVEVAVKKYKAGESESKHYHKIAKEVTVIITGRVIMNGVEYKEGDIIEIEPKEVSDFNVIEDTLTCVVKIPGANNDKYLGECES